MAEHSHDDPNSYPVLGRMLHWVDKPGSATLIVRALVVVCVLLVAADFFYVKHGHFEIEHFPGFYGLFGFVMFTLLILAAKTLRLFIKRPEEYYGDKAIDAEPYPEDQLERVGHNVD